MAKKDRGEAVNLDSFLDIMTCLVGVLVLIIILTGIDASQIKMLVPTPKKIPTDKRPVFVECYQDSLYHVPVDELIEKSDLKLRELAEQVNGNTEQLMQLLSQTKVTEGSYTVDLTYALLAQHALERSTEAEGMPITQDLKGSGADWLKKLFGSFNPDEEMITFLVRDDSYAVFKRARKLAWESEVEVAYQLLDIRDPIRFGIGGMQIETQ